MSQREKLITIGFSPKDGDADFGISSIISSLSYDEIKKLREIIPVAIYVMEDMWRRSNVINPVLSEKQHMSRGDE